MAVVIADAGPLIGIARIGYLCLLQQLYAAVLIPPRIAEELRLSGNRPGAKAIGHAIHAGWIEIAEVTSRQNIPLLDVLVDAGEAEAIRLALEHQADLLIIDDRKGRKAAKSHGIRIIGTGGVLIAAKQAGLIENVAPLLETLAAVGYRLSPELCKRILELANES
ncbi:DUF3368 domain-containing protein [candidate division KSB3 bacterium]|uniref:DUF3368 domain-containing protein n=1 Tax=candidate division KSB3 bacterium TaxID=2044937 RepID=A0A9D5JTE5_9BACT|nr:DUF3368 domain-containing protein [candidate division KSB3 bacterium]MBD3323882.1 DUF3368 domain-containing protein [candidate division KSB3 bacterium]